MEHGASVVVYIAQIVVLLIAGRVAGESMQRIGQPPVIGQIIAGIVVGPSVLGLIAPGLYHNLFPNSAEQKAMLDAVAQLGILLLLLMTGMETDLSVFRDVRRPVISISRSGISPPRRWSDYRRGGDPRRHRRLDHNVRHFWPGLARTS